MAFGRWHKNKCKEGPLVTCLRQSLHLKPPIVGVEDLITSELIVSSTLTQRLI